MEIVKESGVKSSGDLSRVLKELIQCGFIQMIDSAGLKKSESSYLYRSADEYSLFFFNFLSPNASKNNWSQIEQTPTFKTWSAYAFENICFKHALQTENTPDKKYINNDGYSWTWKEKDDALIQHLFT